MRRLCSAISSVAPLTALALAGCGASQPTAPTTSITPPNVTIPFKSDQITGAAIPARYTCDGANIAPSLTWGAVPSSVRELAVFAIDVTSTKSGVVEWAMGGLPPGLHHLAAGQVPKGAFVVTASNGKRSYSICPPKGQPHRYKFALYALPSIARATAQITGPKLLFNLTEARPEYRAPASGTFLTTYARK
jgi:phosphatidylethanolamine-binding protein (PEBP) family uncharacterized protein